MHPTTPPDAWEMSARHVLQRFAIKSSSLSESCGSYILVRRGARGMAGGGDGRVGGGGGGGGMAGGGGGGGDAGKARAAAALGSVAFGTAERLEVAGSETTQWFQCGSGALTGTPRTRSRHCQDSNWPVDGQFALLKAGMSERCGSRQPFQQSLHEQSR